MRKKTTGFLIALLAGALILVGQQPAEASKGKHHKNWRGVYSGSYNKNFKRGKHHRKNWKNYNRNNGFGNNCRTSNNNGRRRYNRAFNNSIIPTNSYWRGNNSGLIQGLLGPGNGYGFGNTRFVGGGHPVHGYNHPGHGAFHPVYGVQNTGGINNLVNNLF